MSYLAINDDGETAALGFSLKPPKWLRKMKPGKVLVPLAAVAGTLLIPGVGGLLVGGITAAAKAIGAGAAAAAGAATPAIQSLAPLVAPQVIPSLVSPPAWPPMQPPPPPTFTTPQPPPPPSIPAGPPRSVTSISTLSTPVLLGAAALLFALAASE